MADDLVVGIVAAVDDLARLAEIVGVFGPGPGADEGHRDDGPGRRRQPHQTVGHEGAAQVGITDRDRGIEAANPEPDPKPIKRIAGKGMFVDRLDAEAGEDLLGDRGPAVAPEDRDRVGLDAEGLGIMIEGATEQDHVADAVHADDENTAPGPGHRPVADDQVEEAEQPPAPAHAGRKGAPPPRRGEAVRRRIRDVNRVRHGRRR